MYAGCVAGAIQKTDYLNLLKDQGFHSISLQKEKPITIPEDILERYLSESDMLNFITSGIGIFSITVYGEKPQNDQQKPKLKLSELQETSSCDPKSGCC